MSLYNKLAKVDVSDKVEKKGELTYLAWAWAWTILKKYEPSAKKTIYKNELGWNYFTDGRTAWVEVGITADNIEHIEHLAIMDFRNQSIPLDKIKSTDVTKSIQRAGTKAIARHGLGLYIYAGEDIPSPVQDLLDTARDLFGDCDQKDPDALADFLQMKGYKPVEFKNFNEEKLEGLVGELSALLTELS